MKDTKFRVWDDIARKMWYPGEGLRACITQIGSVCTDETDDGGILENRSYRLTAIFYTGLKDKNGKEIYGGDIVDWVKKGNTYFIESCELTGGYQMITKSRLGHLTLHSGYTEDCEIIGNLWENPELLEEVK